MKFTVAKSANNDVDPWVELTLTKSACMLERCPRANIHLAKLVLLPMWNIGIVTNDDPNVN